MPRAEKLSTRLEALLETVFQSPSDPFALYWDIAAHIGPEEIAQTQRTIRKKLKERDHVSPETAILIACLMNLGGFSPQRILHFISLYIPGGIRPSLFELVVGVIFLGEPPVPASVEYDLSQYTYLEKRLLVRKSIEITEKLADAMDPRALLYLYLLALRDDLSNEHVQLIALVLKKSIPSRELRGRIGSASLEEYGEIARAVKAAEERSLDLDLAAGPGTGRPPRRFDRDSASFFLDKYFSDEAIAEARASAPRIPKRPPASRPASRTLAEPAPTVPEARARTSKASEAMRAPPAPDTSGATELRRTARARGPSGLTKRRPAKPREDGAVAPRAGRTARPRGRAAHPAVVAWRAGRPGSRRASVLIALPTVIAVVVLAIVLGVVPAGPRSPSSSRRPDGSSTNGVAAPAGSAPSVRGRVEPSPPATMTYLVKPGDSLWKIFTTMQTGADRSGWREFLSHTRAANDLGDPDQLRPGRVLTLSPSPR